MQNLVSSISVALIIIALPVLLIAVDFPAVDDGHDDAIAGTFVGRLGLAGRRSRSKEHHFADAGADGIGGNDRRTGRFAVAVDDAENQEPQTDKALFLLGGHDSPHHLGQIHGVPRLLLGGGLPAQRDDGIDVGVGAGDNVG